MVITDNEDGGGNGNDDKVLRNMPRDGGGNGKDDKVLGNMPRDGGGNWKDDKVLGNMPRDGGGNWKDDKVLGNMPRDVGKTFTIDVRKGVKKDTKGCLPCLPVASEKKRALEKMSKDFGKNKIKYQTVPTTSRRMLRKNKCVIKDNGMPRRMLKDVEFLFIYLIVFFFKQK